MHSMCLPFPWGDYLGPQQAANDNFIINARSLGCEEALTAILEDFGSNCAPSDSDAVQRRFGNLCTNRRAKYRQRKQLNKKWADENSRESSAADHTEVVATVELVELLRVYVSRAEWQLLWKLAGGSSYREVAAQCGISVGNLKSRTSRIRDRVRNSNVGRRIQLALNP